MTLFQLDPSAQAPCTSTIVAGFDHVAASVLLVLDHSSTSGLDMLDKASGRFGCSR